MRSRRDLLGGLGVAATLLAGCSGSGGGRDYATPGETRELGGLAFTVTGVTESSTVDVTGRNTPEGGTAAYPTTRLRAGTDGVGNSRRLLVVDLTARNPGDDEQELPAPAPTPPAAAGRISITGTGRGITPQSVAGELLRDGTAAASFGAEVADLDWALPPGDSVSGWLLFRVGDSFDRTSNTLTVEIDATTARWQLDT